MKNMNSAGRIAPSLDAAELGSIREQVKRIEQAGADLIHIDIMDGVFVPNLTFGPWILDIVRSVSDLPLDCHLMVSRPGDSINPGNPVMWVEELLDWVDGVQVMGVDPGFSGQDFISKSIQKI